MGLNQQPLTYQMSTLPIELQAHNKKLKVPSSIKKKIAQEKKTLTLLEY